MGNADRKLERLEIIAKGMRNELNALAAGFPNPAQRIQSLLQWVGHLDDAIRDVQRPTEGRQT